jgi:uncharacterized peroxidase-related enzyme
VPAGTQDALLDGLASGRAEGAPAAADRVMLEYASKLSETPGDMTEDDVTTLRAHGYDDRAIHDICAITAYYAFVNRIADGLGVELEDEPPGRHPRGGAGGQSPPAR